MNIRTKILKSMLEREMIEYDDIGIARSAVDKGYDLMSDKQKYRLQKYFSPVCEGDFVNNDCSTKLHDEDLLVAIEESLIYEKISCSECRNLTDYQKISWAKMEKE